MSQPRQDFYDSTKDPVLLNFKKAMSKNLQNTAIRIIAMVEQSISSLSSLRVPTGNIPLIRQIAQTGNPYALITLPTAWESLFDNSFEFAQRMAYYHYTSLCSFHRLLKPYNPEKLEDGIPNIIRLQIENFFGQKKLQDLVNENDKENYVEYIFHAAMISRFITDPDDLPFRVPNSEKTIKLMKNIQDRFRKLAASPFESAEFKQFDKLSDNTPWKFIRELLSDVEAEDVLRKKFIYSKTKSSVSVEYQKAFLFLEAEEKLRKEKSIEEPLTEKQKKAVEKIQCRNERDKQSHKELQKNEERLKQLVSTSSSSSSSNSPKNSIFFLKATRLAPDEARKIADMALTDKQREEWELTKSYKKRMSGSS